MVTQPLNLITFGCPFLLENPSKQNELFNKGNNTQSGTISFNQKQCYPYNIIQE